MCSYVDRELWFSFTEFCKDNRMVIAHEVEEAVRKRFKELKEAKDEHNA